MFPYGNVRRITVNYDFLLNIIYKFLRIWSLSFEPEEFWMNRYSWATELIVGFV